MSVLLNYQPSEVVRAGLRMREAGSSTNPLWSVLPPAKLESIVSTLETVLSSPAGQAPAKEAAGSNAPSMTLLHSGNRERPANKRGDARQKESNEISQAAMAASAKLLEVLRAHAASRAASGDDRVTLGDLTTIAFAESNQRLAAAEHGSTPQAREPDSTSDAVPNDKLFKSERDLSVKLQAIAKKILKDLKQEDSSADTRQGQS